MRKVTFGAASSIDGYIARRDGGVDWLRWSADAASIMAKFWKTIDTVVMGRKTWEVAVKNGTTAYPGVKSFVCSRKLKKSPDAKIEIVRDAARLVRKLKQSRGKGICVMGGGELARSLFQAGLLDEVGLNVHPVLLGSGIPLFHRMRRQIDLELVESRRLKRDCVLLTYRVRG